MDYLIYYFSGTGNTWWVAKVIQLLLIKKNFSVKCTSIEKEGQINLDRDIRENSHIIIGFPVYGSTSSTLMQQFLENFPKGDGQLVSIFGTHALASGDSAFYLGSVLEKKGYSLCQTKHFKMMNNIHLPNFKFYPPDSDEKMKKTLENVKPEVIKFTNDIILNKIKIRGDNFLGHFLGGLQRKHIDSMFDKLGKLIRINRGMCINCGLCKKICPTKNITKIYGEYTFNNRCTACLRCYSQCPQNAIIFSEENKNIDKYPRYKGPTNFNPNKLIE